MKYNIKPKTNEVTNKACKATMRDVVKLAKIYNVTNLIMINAIFMGGFRNELEMIMSQ